MSLVLIRVTTVFNPLIPLYVPFFTLISVQQFPSVTQALSLSLVVVVVDIHVLEKVTIPRKKRSQVGNF
ncbi:hypothetical protein KPH14_010462 [Odynerus spinipes]|uniref:Uncharacterized protein n=1 Tax=Odynerus spinipes TaxID=1348599 RepID=A0AAD9RU43_9HYME|nr:hypothetical protein KPH14_010462 [Odynerus spinipes]